MEKDADRELMEWIHSSCGREIAEATGGNRSRSALLAALTANESGGRRHRYRFAPGIHERLRELCRAAGEMDGLTSEQLLERLGRAGSEEAKAALLKMLAGLHGYTQMPGYLSVRWGVPVEEFLDPGRHFQYAARRLEDLCSRLGWDAEGNAEGLGRLWTGETGNARSGIYGWRLRKRMRLYAGIEGGGG